MLVTYLRSSSIGGYHWCQQKYFIEYVLGRKSPANLKAEKGNVTHKALELLAQQKLAQQRGEPGFFNEELSQWFTTDTFEPDDGINRAFDHYSDPSRTTHTWSERDREDCRAYLYNVLHWGNDCGMFDPRRREVVVPEQYFDFEVPHTWASYDYELPDGNRLCGRLALKGTMDLVSRLEPGVIEYLDWKTGQRKDWAKNKVKEYADLREDAQFMLYYYALRQLYPGEHVIITVFYTQDGGPFTVYFDDNDIPRIEKMLEDIFLQIKNNHRPKLIWPSWKCSKLCEFAKPDSSGNIFCHTLRDELVELGMNRVIAKYGDLSRLGSYGDGGGRSQGAGDV